MKTLNNTNSIKYIIRETLFTIALLFSSGSFVQTFMLAKGIESHLVALYPSLIQIIQTVAILACSLICDRIKKVKRIILVLTLFLPITFGGFLISELPGLINNNAYVIILTTSMLANFALGFYNVFIYKFPYHVIETKEYGKLCSVNGILANVLSILLTTLVSVLVNYMDYDLLMIIVFSFGIVLWVLSAIVCKTMKDVEIKEENEDNKEKTIDNDSNGFISLIKNPYFYKLIPANLLRGVGLGILSQIVLIGTFDNILNTNLSIIISAITCIATVVGSLLYIFIEKKFTLNSVLVVSSIVILGSAPFITLFGLIPLYVFYFIAYVFIYVISIIFPVYIIKFVPYNVAGKYNALRMLLFTLGQAIPGFFIVSMMESFGTLPVLIIGAVCTAFACIMYVLVFRKAKEIKYEISNS